MATPDRWRLTASTTLMLALVAPLAAAAPEPRKPVPPPFQGGFPVTRRDALFAYKDLAVGDRGIGYTVFRGGEVEPFEVEILGIMEGMLGPHRDVILAKLTGPKIEFTGVISGMSGSPVYFDGKLLGAVSYRFGSFSKEAIAGITPIQSMLDIARDPQIFPPPAAPAAPAPASGAAVGAAVRLGQLHAGPSTPPLALPRAWTRHPELRPIDAPITLGGFPPSEAEALRGRLAEAGLTAVVGGAQGSASKGGGRLRPNEATVVGGVVAPPIAPASPIAAVIMRGDLDAAGTGTVTFLDGEEVLAFGHPFFGYGHVAFPMATAAILNTLASPLGSYKMSASSIEVGSVSEDRLSAIGGRLGRAVEMVPLEVRVEADRPQPAPIVTRVEIVDHELWLPSMVRSAIASAGVGRLGEEAGGSVDLEATLVVRDRAAGRGTNARQSDRTLVLRDTYSASAPYRPAAFAAQDVAGVVAMLIYNGLAAGRVEKIDVRLRVRPTVELAWLEAVVPSSHVVMAGSELTVKARVRPFRAEPRWATLTIPIPRDATGELEVVVGGAGELDARDELAFGERVPDDLDDLLGILAERRSSDRLYARVYLKRPGVRAGTEILSSLPPSLRLGLEDVASVRERAVTEAVGPATSVAWPGVIVGAQTLKIQVVEGALRP